MQIKKYRIQIPSWSSPLQSSHPDSAGVDPKLIQFYNTTWRSAEWSTFSLPVSSDVSQEPTGILSISFLEQVDELEAFTALVLLRKGILKLVKSWLRVLWVITINAWSKFPFTAQDNTCQFHLFLLLQFSFQRRQKTLKIWLNASVARICSVSPLLVHHVLYSRFV